MLNVDRTEVRCPGVRVGAIAPQSSQVSQAEKGEISIEVATRAGYPSQTGRTPTFPRGPQHAVLGVHPPPPPGSDIHVPCPCLPLLALAALAALPCALPAATAACTPDSAWDPLQPGCPLPRLARPFSLL